MYKILLITILVSFLNAANPKPYSVLGDVIYDNAQNIQKLANLEVYIPQKDAIIKYLDDVNNAKDAGYTLEASKNKASKKPYLNKLRELSKKNDSYNRSAKANYKISIKDENSPLFSQMINSGIIDTQKNKQEIINYYFAHSEDINTSGVIQTYLDEDAKLKALREAQRKKYKSKKQREQEKIKRIRANDQIAQKKLEAQLQKELVQKKKEIRKVQREELHN